MTPDPVQEGDPGSGSRTVFWFQGIDNAVLVALHLIDLQRRHLARTFGFQRCNRPILLGVIDARWHI